MLRFSNRTEYGLRALMELAARRADGYIPAKEIARRQGIPVKFLEQQLAALHKAGLVDSQRGPRGGAVLARDPEEIRLADVIEVLEGSLAPMYCLEPHDERCVLTHQCGLQELWVRVEAAVRSVFEQTTLADLVTRHSALQPLLWPVHISRATRDG